MYCSLRGIFARPGSCAALFYGVVNVNAWCTYKINSHGFLPCMFWPVHVKVHRMYPLVVIQFIPATPWLLLHSFLAGNRALRPRTKRPSWAKSLLHISRCRCSLDMPSPFPTPAGQHKLLVIRRCAWEYAPAHDGHGKAFGTLPREVEGLCCPSHC